MAMATVSFEKDRSARTAGWKLNRTVEGWALWSRPWPDCDPLAVHAGWHGPVKLVRKQSGIEQRVEVFLGGGMDGMDALGLDEEEAGAAEALFEEIVQAGFFGDAAESVAGWQPPAAEALAGWLAEAGYEPAIDREQNLRLTRKRLGCDGQIRLERGDGRLRLCMPLGRWADLVDAVEHAMRSLADEANATSRLVRIAWQREENDRRCEAQVDLTALPVPRAGEPCRQRFWRDMLRMSMAGLELALRRLGLELLLLAEPQNRALVELFHEVNRGD
jgi:hypothetical protein